MLMLTNGETPNNHLSPLHLLDAVSRWVLDLPGLEDRVAFTSELHQSEMRMLLGNSGAGWVSLLSVQVPQAPNCQPWIEPPCVPSPPFPEINSLNRRPLDWIGLDWQNGRWFSLKDFRGNEWYLVSVLAPWWHLISRIFASSRPSSLTLNISYLSIQTSNITEFKSN